MNMQKDHNIHEWASKSNFNIGVESFSPKLAANIFEISINKFEIYQ